jgi:hypothetical protein
MRSSLPFMWTFETNRLLWLEQKMDKYTVFAYLRIKAYILHMM